MTREEWAKAALALASYYPTCFSMSGVEQMEFWYNALKSHSGPSVLAAIVTMAKTQRAFPSIADIRRLASGEPLDPIVLWSEVEAKAALMHRDHPFLTEDGQWTRLQWTNPRIGRALDAVGGVRAFVQTPEAQRSAMRAQFCRAYEALAVEDERAGVFEAMGVALPSLPEPAGATRLLADSTERAGFDAFRESAESAFPPGFSTADNIRLLTTSLIEARVPVDTGRIKEILATDLEEAAKQEACLLELYKAELQQKEVTA